MKSSGIAIRGSVIYDDVSVIVKRNRTGKTGTRSAIDKNPHVLAACYRMTSRPVRSEILSPNMEEVCKSQGVFARGLIMDETIAVPPVGSITSAHPPPYCRINARALFAESL